MTVASLESRVPSLLPVHGFVLAGGKSSRMGRDKATLPFQGKTLVELAAEKLRAFCAEVSIVGNRDDLAIYAPVVREERVDCGPAAGVEAGLKASTQPWALFIPVDVPLVPGAYLRDWVEEALEAEMSVSYLMTFLLGAQPAFCLLERTRQPSFSRLIDAGERRLEVLLNQSADADGTASWAYDERELYGHFRGKAEDLPDDVVLARWFANLNTPDDLAALED